MVATFEQKIARQQAAALRRAASEAAIDWQACYLAGAPARQVDEAEQAYLLLIRQARMLEAR